MQQDHSPLALDLFLKFQPRFRRVRWKAYFLGEVVYGSERQAYERFYLAPLLRGENEPCGIYFQTGMNKVMFDLRRSNLRPAFKFNPFNKTESIYDQLMQATKETVEKELSKTKFYLDPAPGALMFKKWWGSTAGYGQFSAEGRVPAGVEPGWTFGVPDWRFFIPPGPEQDAIKVALELDQENKVRDRRTAHYCDKLQTQLTQHIKEAA